MTRTPQERQAYEDSLKHYRDLKNSNDTARLEGLQEGLEEGEKIGIAKIVRSMAAKGLDITSIAEMTDINVAEIQQLLSQQNT